MKRAQFCLLGMSSLVTLAAAAARRAAPPILIADFEGKDYGEWQARGDAFGSGPARGTLSNQMVVSGFKGKGLVNSFLGGDDATGTLSSPDFKIQRKFITFLIGGGGWKETCMFLIVDGQVVRIATGPNTQPGGTEWLEPAAWDVTEFLGKSASLIIIDQRKGGWGHINIDHIMQTDDKGEIPLAGTPKPPLAERTRTLTITADFLQLPLVHREDGNKPGLEKLSIEVDGKLQRYMHVEFPTPGQEPDFWYSADLRELKGKTVTLRYRSHDAEALNKLKLSNKEIRDPKAYATEYRPRFHFSPRLGWMNDINGSYYQNGLYHIFYQFNPATTSRGAGFDMHWGHSVSKDLIHWEEWPVALFPNGQGQCYSGTAVMQQQPLPGLNEGVALPAPVLFFAGTEPFSQHIATTPDGGKTWKRYPGNPVVKNMGDGDRDPKVIWHAASQHYVMVLYVGGPDTYRILRSKDLVHWEQTDSLPGWFECPEFIPVKSPTTGEELMLLYGGYHSPQGTPDRIDFNSCYQLGRFDGQKFTPVTKVRKAHQGPSYYAALVFSNAPQGRHVMMGWAQGTRFPGENFNQCGTLPLLLQLKAIGGEDTLCFEPVEELNSLRGKPLVQLSNATVAEANNKLAMLKRDAGLEIVLKTRGNVSATIRSIHFAYDAATKTLKRNDQPTVLHPNVSLDARFFIDRGIVESFWNGGEAAYTIGSLHTDNGPAFALEGDAIIEELTVYPLKDIWKK
ncbi:MAG: glycoside hydrolase family 32 protein [Armatimonas sp.]